jgi:hypothetical protein
MPRRNRTNVLAISTATVLTAGFADGQQVPCSTPGCLAPAALEVAAGLRAQAEQGRMDHALLALIQLWRTHPSEELEALADSLMEVGIDLATHQGPGGHTIGSVAANSLITAATWRPDPGHGRGMAYPPAADRVVEMAYRLPGGDVGILNQVRPIIGDEQWVARMRQIATSDLDPGAARAVVTLEREGSGGIEVLRELYDEDLVAEPRARWWLQELAKARGWGKLDRSVQSVGARYSARLWNEQVERSVPLAPVNREIVVEGEDAYLA